MKQYYTTRLKYNSLGNTIKTEYFINLSENNNKHECLICFNEINSIEKTECSVCKKIYCIKCLSTWFFEKNKMLCPHCKYEWIFFIKFSTDDIILSKDGILRTNKKKY